MADSTPNVVYEIVDEDDNSGLSTSGLSVHARAYQLEMFEASMQENVVVVMETGTGKTQVAIMRIQAELERAPQTSLMWFLAPTIALGDQQYKVIRQQIPSVHTKFLTGNDKVELWSQAVWRTLLDGVRIVVSTYQVLYSALAHAYLNMGDLALIVFDEASCCTRKHPGCQIMDFYQRDKQQAKSVPHIMGLTASPGSSTLAIDSLEKTLDAVCKSPTLHREELIAMTNKPSIQRILYDKPTLTEADYTPSMAGLVQAYSNLDLSADPDIRMLSRKRGEDSEYRLKTAIDRRNTYCQTQLASLWRMTELIRSDLGPWAADWYYYHVTEPFWASRRSQPTDREGQSCGSKASLDWQQRDYIAQTLKSDYRVPPDISPGSGITDKVSRLIECLAAVEDNPVAIVFVKERVTAYVLLELLSSYPEVRDKFKMDVMIGTSNFPKRSNLYEFRHTTGMKPIEDFRSGKTNLLISTSVTECGIDIPDCNLIISLSPLETLGSFIQKLGRARKAASRVLLFQPRYQESKAWETLELEMKIYYEDEERRQNLELSEVQSSEGFGQIFHEPHTGARLDYSNCKSKLSYFCHTIPGVQKYLDREPRYIFHPVGNQDPPWLQAEVVLPPIVPVPLRRFRGGLKWLSQKKASQDAAFNAFHALYQAGLVNNHLVPLIHQDSRLQVEKGESKLDVRALLQPWEEVAKGWMETESRWSHALYHLGADGQSLVGEYQVILPIQLPEICTFAISTTGETQGHIRILPNPRRLEPDYAIDHTAVLLQLAHGHKYSIHPPRNHVVKFVAKDASLALDRIGSLAFKPENNDETRLQLVRGSRQSGVHGLPFWVLGVLPSKPTAEEMGRSLQYLDSAPSDESYLIVQRVTRRCQFSPPTASLQGSTVSKRLAIPVSWASVDDVPDRHTYFGFFIPYIMHTLGVHLIGHRLFSGLLKPVRLSNFNLVLTAICSKGAEQPHNYERFEFLGDSILKFCATVTVIVAEPDWPEGYWTEFRGHLVSNKKLYKAALEVGLDEFILIEKTFRHKWRPLYVEDLRHGPDHGNGTRSMSTKTIADVVEALIGAAFLDGGFARALDCISVFIQDVPWQMPAVARDLLKRKARAGLSLEAQLLPVEGLIGHTFGEKLLLIEAMSHGSYASVRQTQSYDRLEFLGDAILEYIVVTRLMAVRPPLPHDRMHLLKSTLVNGAFLAFLALELSIEEQVIKEAEADGTPICTQTTNKPLCFYMSFENREIATELQQLQSRHAALRGRIWLALRKGARYPWALLGRLAAPKFASDMVESLLGAIWVDCVSDPIDACTRFLGSLGLLSYADRAAAATDLELFHPKEKLGQFHCETIRYIISRRSGLDDRTLFDCRVNLDEQPAGQSEDGGSREEAETCAAEDALVKLGRWDAADE